MQGVRCPTFVGRTEELGQLTDLVAAASIGRGGAAFVLGQEGIGKSRLLAAAGDIARSRGMTVLRGRAGPSPAPAPYRPLAEAMLSVMRGREAHTDAALAPFAPAFGALAPGLFAVEVEQEPSVVLLGEAVLALLESQTSPGGAALLLEDLHWAGDETLEVVEYLTDKLDARPVALLASVRTGESSSAERLAHAVGSRRLSLVVTLPPLDAPQVDAFIATSLGGSATPDDLNELVRQASGGVPFLVEELLASLTDAGALWREGGRWETASALPALVPASFAALVAERVASLSETARRVVVAAAVIGEDFDWRLVGRVTGLDESEMVTALREAVTSQLVDEASQPAQRFRFRHGLSRAAVLETLLRPERELLARQTLDVLEDSTDEAGAPPADASRLELVAELAVTARSDVAVRALINAAAAAAGRGACLSVRRSAELAVQLATTDEEKIDANEALLGAYVASGDAARAAELGRTFVDGLHRLAADASRIADAHLQLAAAAVHGTNWTEAESHLDEAERAGRLPAPERARAGLLRTSIALGRHLPHAAVDHARRSGDAAREIGDDRVLAEALWLLGRAHRVLDIEAARRDFAEALGAAQRTGSQLLVARAAHEAATIDVLTAGTTRRTKEARLLASNAGATSLVASTDLHLGILHWLHFDVDASRHALESALDAAHRYDLGLLAAASASVLAGCAAISGRRQEAIDLFERYLPEMDNEMEATCRGNSLALADLVSEDRAGAIDQLERAAALAPEYSDVARSPLSGMRAVLLAVEDDEAASPVAHQLQADIAVVGVPRALTELALAVLAGRAHENAEADRRARRAFAGLDTTPWFSAIGQRLAGEAALNDGWGAPTAWLLSALGFFEGESIPEPAVACRRMLRTSGASVPRQPSRGEHPELARLGVTAREAEVLALVAQGLSNREVAETLVLSVRTVEKHVEHLMTKTLTTNRAHLAAFATRLAPSAAGST